MRPAARDAARESWPIAVLASDVARRGGRGRAGPKRRFPRIAPTPPQAQTRTRTAEEEEEREHDHDEPMDTASEDEREQDGEHSGTRSARIGTGDGPNTSTGPSSPSSTVTTRRRRWQASRGAGRNLPAGGGRFPDRPFHGIADLVTLSLPNEGPTSCEALILIMWNGKVNKHHKVEPCGTRTSSLMNSKITEKMHFGLAQYNNPVELHHSRSWNSSIRNLWRVRPLQDWISYLSLRLHHVSLP
jgi:hypothetical protein